MYSILRQYNKKELCHLMGAGYSEFLEENYDLTLKIPALILVGEEDRTGKVQQYDKAWHERTGYPLHVIKNAAHNSNMDNAAQVNEEIEWFLRNLKKITPP